MDETVSEQKTEPAYSAKLSWKVAVPAAIAALLLLVISLLPTGLEYAGERWLRAHGVKDAKIENIDLNLFSGEFSLHELHAGDGLNITFLSAKVDWLPLLDNTLHLRSLVLKSANIDLQEREPQVWLPAGIELDVSADREPASESDPASAPEPWLAVVDDFQLTDLSLMVNGREMQLKLPVDSLKLNLSALQQERQTLAAEIRLGATDFSGFGYRVNQEQFDLSAKLNFSLHADDPVASLRSDAMALKLAGLKLADAEGQPLAALTSLELNGIEAEGMDRQRVASVRLEDVALQPQLTGSGSLKLASVAIEKLDVDLHAEIAFDTLLLKQLEADAMAGGDDRMRLQQLEMQGFKTKPGETLSLQSLGLKQFDLKQQQGKQLLASFESGSLQQLAMASAEKGSFEKLKLDGVRLPATGKKSIGSIGSIVATKAAFDLAGHYHLKQLKLNRLDTTLIKQKSGGFVVLDELAAAGKPVAKKGAQSEVSKAAAKQGGKSREPVVVIDELLISSGSKIAYRDESLSPALDTRMQVKKFRLAPLDLSGRRDGRLDVEMGIGKYGEFTAKGALRPHAEKLKSDLNVSLKHFDMPGLSGFIESDFGKSIQTGQFNLDAAIKISDNTIDAKNSLVIRKLELGDSDQPGKAEQSLGMPVGMALDMLRNDRGDIEMDVPVSGKLDDPNISLNAIINKALMSSLSAGAMTYATLALQPYGSIILAADLASDLIKEASKPKLTPISFAELETTLNSQMQDYASKIAALLNKSSALRLKVCGIATRVEGAPVAEAPADQAGSKAVSERLQVQSDDELLKLAEARSDAVIAALQQHGIAVDRLYGCRAAIDTNKRSGTPRVELIVD